MKDFRYLKNVATLRLDRDKCVGCGLCETVCPHRIFRMEGEKAAVTDPDGCMECGACAVNCPSGAVTVTPGVGCAAHIMQTWIARFTGVKIQSDCC